jgi:HlyD family secretion protein
VDEADVGSVKVGQKASFTVSAYPAPLSGQVTRVAFGSTKTDNVVTYITWLEVDNSDLSLRPGMTAAATITATERNDVLLVPNTALRFTPGGGGVAAQPAAVVAAASCRSSCRACRARAAPAGAGPRQRRAAVRQVWVLQDGQAGGRAVTPGISDGRMTEVSGEGCKKAWP